MKTKRSFRNNITRLFLLAIVALSLTACGPDGTYGDGGHGGGGGGHGHFSQH